jgi:microcystin degradation protein MlrC
MAEPSAPMKIFLAGILAETNSFSSCPTGMGAFEEQGIRLNADSLEDPMGMLGAVKSVRRLAGEGGHTLVEGIIAAAQPLGPVVEPAYQWLKAKLLSDLAAALPVDAIVLLLHGAMTSENCEDCEGDILEAVRQMAGPDAAIGVCLDPHCHFTQRMRQRADILVAYKEYPHTDINASAEATAQLTLSAAAGRIKPAIGVFDCRMVGLWPTIQEPMKGFVEKMRGLEQEPDILSVSLGHGMAYGDVPEAGAKVWVITDNKPDLADRIARELGEELFLRREAIATPTVPLAQAVGRVADWEDTRLLVLADIADNPGGGAQGDSTFILKELIERGIGRVALGGLWDPGAVQMAREAGVGARFRMRIGGKTGSVSGAPVDVVATVMRTLDEHSQDDFGARASLGPSAWVRTDAGLDVVLISRRQQVLGMDLFTGLGIELEALRGIVVKSMQHFRASFEPLIGEVLFVDTPGLMRSDFEAIPFARRDLNYWPRAVDPFGQS